MSKIPHIFYGFLFVCLSACMQTKSLVTEADEDLSRIPAPTYAGCFASFIDYNKNFQRCYNDSVTALCNNICDSIMRQGFKKLPKLNKAFIQDSIQANALSGDFLNIINKAIKKETIKNLRCSDMLAQLCVPYQAERFLFIIPCGYTRLAGKTKAVTAYTQARQIIGRNLANNNANNDTTANFMFFPSGQLIHAQGSNIYALVYHKSSGRFTFYRQQFFLNEKIHPMQRKYLKKQLDYLLKEYL